jgi:hypothetical protein
VTVTVNKGTPAPVTRTDVIYITSHLSGTIWVGYVFLVPWRVFPCLLADMRRLQPNTVYHVYQLGKRYGLLASRGLDWLT